MSSAQQIAEFEQQIRDAHECAQRASARDYREEMAYVSKMRAKLAEMKAELEAQNDDNPFALLVDEASNSDDWDWHDNEKIIERECGRIVGPGLYTDLSNEEYHSGPGISKSGLDYIANNPSFLPWSKRAPVDTEKLNAMDMGTALHCALLEPDEFEQRFIIMPEFNLRTNDGKASRDSFLNEVASEGKTILAAADHRLLKLMKESVMAHPVARMIFEADGQNESSIYWNDEATGELCRCRPDRKIIINDMPTLVDVKKCADMSRFARHVEEFRYHVQDAMYRDGFESLTGTRPDFWFLVVDCNASAGRYPVDVVDLDAEWQQAGYDLYRRDLETYHQCRRDDDWLHIHTLSRPRWANK